MIRKGRAGPGSLIRIRTGRPDSSPAFGGPSREFLHADFRHYHGQRRRSRGGAAITDPHLRPALDVVGDLVLDPVRGLDDAEAARRREVFGENRLAELTRRPAWLRFLDQFRSLLILILLAAALLAGLVGDLKDTVVIAVVLLVNAAIGFVQENRAERSLEALRDMLVPTARVRRGGAVRVEHAAGLVPGDLVLLEAGDRVPADGRLLVAESVEIDESALTGESQPVGKGTAAATTAGSGQKVPLAERTCMAYLNTTLTRGRAELVVTATGMATEVGAIAGLLQGGENPPHRCRGSSTPWASGSR